MSQQLKQLSLNKNLWNNPQSNPIVMHEPQYQFPFSHCSKNEIIQCPNPTANPIINHLEQQQMQKEQKEQINKVQNMKQMEQRLAAQNELIERMSSIQYALIQKTNEQSLQLMQHKNYITLLQQQNHSILTAYNALKTQFAAQSVSSQTECNYEKWSVNDVIAWITKLDNGRFLQYAYCFCLSGVDGKQLTNVSEHDLDKMGIKDCNDRVLLLEHIGKIKKMRKVTQGGMEGLSDTKSASKVSV